MTRFVHSLITETEEKVPDYVALKYGDKTLSYADLRKELGSFSCGLMAAGLGRSERVAIYAEKRFETVIAMFGTSMAGGVYVPINPLLKTELVMPYHERLRSAGSGYHVGTIEINSGQFVSRCFVENYYCHGWCCRNCGLF